MFYIIINIMNINKTAPDNYLRIDKYVSRSAQPNEANILWLKEQGVTDIINFRTMYVPAIGFNEERFVKAQGMTYHNIPSISKKPKEANVGKFLDIIEGVKRKTVKCIFTVNKEPIGQGCMHTYTKDFTILVQKPIMPPRWLNKAGTLKGIQNLCSGQTSLSKNLNRNIFTAIF